MAVRTEPQPGCIKPNSCARHDFECQYLRCPNSIESRHAAAMPKKGPAKRQGFEFVDHTAAKSDTPS